jgi:hypothetical protein
MNQNPREAATQEAAQVFALLYHIQGLLPPRWIKDANTYYAVNDDLIPALCKYLKELPSATRDQLLYSDAKDLSRRRIATWWEKHEKVDRDREADVARARNAFDLRESARAKLTPEERRALGLE